jgi:hypothetical protein
MHFRPGFCLSVAWTALVLAGSPAVAAETVNPLLGQWARTAADCAHPKLTFAAEKASIYVEADGTPTTFDYPETRYVIDGAKIGVDLKTTHPFSKTASKTALEFLITAEGEASLQLLKGKSTRFVRCTEVTAH